YPKSREHRSSMMLSECSKHLVTDVFDRPASIDVDIMRRPLIAAFGPLEIIIDQRFGQRMVAVNTLIDGFLSVIRTLHQRLARHIVLVRHFGRIEFNMVSAP